MVEQILPLFEIVFARCVEWTTKLLDAVGGSGVVLVAFCIVLAVGLLFIPLRGRMYSVSSFIDYSVNSIGKQKKSKKG